MRVFSPATRGLLLLVATTFLLTGVSDAAKPTVKLLRHADTDRLAQLQSDFTYATFGFDTPVDKHGNPLSGKVALLPTPGDGSGAPASVDVTLSPGQRWFLPLLQWWGTSYDDGTPDDELLSQDIFKTLEITFTIDGVTVIDETNVFEFYSEFYFDPAVPLDFSPIDAIIFLQGIGVESHPLSVGQHTLTLHIANTQAIQPGNLFLEFNNTWNITVTPK